MRLFIGSDFYLELPNDLMLAAKPKPRHFLPEGGNSWEASGCVEIPRSSNPGVSPAQAGFDLGRAGYYDRRS